MSFQIKKILHQIGSTARLPSMAAWRWPHINKHGKLYVALKAESRGPKLKDTVAHQKKLVGQIQYLSTMENQTPHHTDASQLGGTRS